MKNLTDQIKFPCGLTMKNRFMLAPLTNTQSHENGKLSDEEYNWLTMRAKGNFGLTMSCASHGALGCLKNKFKGLITGPINKELINQSGFEFSGHTEFLADISNVKKVVMLLMNKILTLMLLLKFLIGVKHIIFFKQDMRIIVHLISISCTDTVLLNSLQLELLQI